MEKIKVGIVGAGKAGVNIHGRALTAGKVPSPDLFPDSSKGYDVEGLYEIAGFYDVSFENAGRAAEIFNARAFRDYSDLLSSDIELVVIATRPHTTHTSLAIQALEKGKHVVVEKPITMSSSEAQEMIDASKKCERILTVHQSRRWDLDFLCVKEVMEKKIMGRIQFVKFLKPCREKPGGLIYEHGSHSLDQMLVLAGCFPIEISAVMENPFAEGYNVGWFDIKMRFENGLFMEMGMLPSEGYVFPCWYLKGENGWWVQDWCDRVEDLFQKTQKKSEMERDYLPEFLQVTMKSPSFYRNLFEAIRERKEPAVKPEESRDVIRLIEIAVESARKNEAIKREKDINA